MFMGTFFTLTEAFKALELQTIKTCESKISFVDLTMTSSAPGCNLRWEKFFLDCATPLSLAVFEKSQSM